MESESAQFRRQLAATIVGALLGISGSCSVASSQWTKQSRQKAIEDRVDAISQFGAALPHLTGGQMTLWHLATRFSVIATRASRLADSGDFTKEAVTQKYNELLKDSWVLVSDYSTAWVEFSKNNAAVNSAYYKLVAAFPSVPDFSWTGAPEQIQLLGTMPEQPNEGSLRALAVSYSTWSNSLKEMAEQTGKNVNTWNKIALDLRQKIRD